MRKISKMIWDEFIYGGQLASIGPLIIVILSYTILGLKQNYILWICTYLIAYPIYSFDRFIGIESDNSKNRRLHLDGHKKIIPFIIIVDLLLLVIFLILLGNVDVILFSAFLLSLGFGYTYFFKKLTSKIVGFKNFFVSIVYTLPAIFPAIFNENLLFPSLLVFLFFAIRILANTSFYDIKDMESDKRNNLKTLVLSLGLKKFYSFMYVCNFVSIIPLIIGVIFKQVNPSSIALLFVIPYAFFYIYLSKLKPTNIERISYIWADGELLLWPILVVIGGIFWNSLG